MRPPRRYADIGVVVGLVLLFVFPLSVRAGQAQTPQDEPAPQALGLSKGLDPGTTVPLDLTRGRFLQALPFDVQFYVLSTVKEQVTRVSGSYARTCSDARTGSGRVNLSPGRFLMTGAPATRSVEISVPALSPNRQYCFAFTLTLKPDEARLRQIVADQLDRHLRDLYDNSVSVITQDALDRFRADLLSGIRDAARELEQETGLALSLTVPRGSFFDAPTSPPAPSSGALPDARPQVIERPGTPADRIVLQERVEFNQLLEVQKNKSNQIGNFRNSASVALDGLTRLRATAPFRQIVAQLRANITQPPVRLRMPTDTMLRFELNKDSDQVNGIAPDQSDADVDKVWDPSELTSRVSNLQATIGQLQSFREMVVALSENPTLRDAAGLNALTPDQFTEVAQLVNSVSNALAEARFALNDIPDLLSRRSAAIAAAAGRVTGELVQIIDIDGTTTASWDTRARSYVSADIGVAWSNPIQSFFFYVGANFYLGPVNKRAPLRWSDPGNFRKRFAFMAAAPINSFDQAQTQTTLSAGGTTLKGVLGDRPLLLGAGLRLNDLVRVTGGTVLFRVKSPNPLIATERLDYAWFMAFSIDWDLRGMFLELQPPAKGRSSAVFRR